MVIIMKSIYTILVTSLVLSGCIYIPGNNPNSPSAKLFDYKPSKDFTRTQSMGPLSCEAGQICPEFTVDWKEQSNNLYTIKADIFHANNYDIQKLNFVVDGQNFTFDVLGPTNYRRLQNSNMTDSSNKIAVPFSFLTQLGKAQSIALQLQTNQGIISGDLLNSGKQAPGYLVFKRALDQHQ